MALQKNGAFCRLAVVRSLVMSAAGLGAVATPGATGTLHAQELSLPTYRYEVVSIHPAAPGARHSGFSPGAQGGLRALNATVMQLLTFAYESHDYLFEGAPDWAKTDRFDINLTPDRPEIGPVSGMASAQLKGWFSRNRQRLQVVLQDRFGLALHVETRELPMYALTVAKNGPKLAPAADDKEADVGIADGQAIIGNSGDMKALAFTLSRLVGRFVKDETGLDGSYDFKVEFAGASTVLGPPGPNVLGSADDTVRPSIFTALTDQVGLRLVSKKGPVPVFVIEKLGRPTEN